MYGYLMRPMSSYTFTTTIQVQKIPTSNPFEQDQVAAFTAVLLLSSIPVQQEYIQVSSCIPVPVGYMYDIHPMYDAEKLPSVQRSAEASTGSLATEEDHAAQNSLWGTKVPVQITCSERLSDLTGHRLRIYPNPADQYVDIYPGLTDDRSETYVIELYDHTGRPIRRIVSGDEVYTLHRNDLPAGIYYIVVRCRWLTTAERSCFSNAERRQMVKHQ